MIRKTKTRIEFLHMLFQAGKNYLDNIAVTFFEYSDYLNLTALKFTAWKIIIEEMEMLFVYVLEHSNDNRSNKNSSQILKNTGDKMIDLAKKLRSPLNTWFNL